jgi:hypothetical protein
MRSIKGLPFIIIAALAVSCDNEPSNKAKFADLSPQAQNYFKMNRSNMTADNSTGFSPVSPMNMSFQKLFNAVGSSGRMADDSSGTEPSDTTIYNDPWISCGQVTTLNNEDGSTTTTYDYGDGCMEGNDLYKVFSFGKYSLTYLNNISQTNTVYNDAYRYKSVYDHFGQRYTYGENEDTTTWITNGNSDYEGASVYDASNNTFSGNYTGNYKLDYNWNGQIYMYEGNSKYTYSETVFTVEKNSYSYSYNTDNYKSDVLEPLVYKYNCGQSEHPIVTYVTGREFIRYKQDDKEGSFEIYYGDGECDNIVVIIENGKRVEVDMSDIYPIMID